MYDFWFTVGVAVMRPALLDDINAVKSPFEFVTRKIQDTHADGTVKVLPAGPSGLINQTATESAQAAIVKFVHQFAGAPPIGIYCAGRFCQMVRITRFDKDPGSSFAGIIALAHTAYRAALTGPESSAPAMPAFLGLCLLDKSLAWDVAALTPKIKGVAQQFGLTADPGNPDWQMVTRYAAANELKQANHFLMEGDNDPWQGGCADQLFFWAPQSEHAIFP